jgi:hypothetical protein
MEFEIVINAPKEKVWNILWSDSTYPEWTAAFSEGSKAVTDWKQGSKVLFLDKNNDGMVSTIAESRPAEFMSIKHLGSVKKGVEDVDSEEAKQWAGSYENYRLEAINGGTALKISMGGVEIPAEFEDYFKDAWPKALSKLKELSEQ